MGNVHHSGCYSFRFNLDADCRNSMKDGTDNQIDVEVLRTRLRKMKDVELLRDIQAGENAVLSAGEFWKTARVRPSLFNLRKRWQNWNEENQKRNPRHDCQRLFGPQRLLGRPEQQHPENVRGARNYSDCDTGRLFGSGMKRALCNLAEPKSRPAQARPDSGDGTRRLISLWRCIRQFARAPKYKKGVWR